MSPWPHRMALAMALSALPLVLFGGSVTTLGAGMAVEGWLIAEGHFLLFFPVDKWFRDMGTFVEHTHRLFGVLVGLFAIATLVSTWRHDRRAAAKLLAVGSLLAVVAQGAIGGLRVLENAPELAFLHGALAQAVFALLAVTALYLAPRWRDALPEREASDGAANARVGTVAIVAALAVYAQIVLGAWYRHGLRAGTTDDTALRFMAHVGGAFLVTALAVTVAGQLTAIGSPRALRLRRGVIHVLGMQVTLGVLALIGYRPGSVGPIEWGLSILHVLGGGLLLFQMVVVAMWARRAARDCGAPSARRAAGIGIEARQGA